MLSIIAAVEPLPLVPATCTEGYAWCGSPSRSASTVILRKLNCAARACCGEASSRPSVSRRSEEHTSELQSRLHLVCRLLLEKKKKKKNHHCINTQSVNTTI